MTVYAAGFARTEAAAQRLEQGSDARRRPLPAPVTPNAEQVGVVGSNLSTGEAPKALPNNATQAASASEGGSVASTMNATPTSDKVTHAAKATVQANGSSSAAESPSSNGSATVSTTARTVPAPTASVPAAASPAVSAPAATTSASIPVTAPITTPIPAPVTAPAAPPAATATSTSAAASPATTAPAAPSTKPATLTDGTYTGWGSSRHGDIEATVVIEGGKITGAIISRCLTQYSCSWVAHLQAQVVTRQSPEVDNVSGATQSANAFYYAVIDALKKAK